MRRCKSQLLSYFCTAPLPSKAPPPLFTTLSPPLPLLQHLTPCTLQHLAPLPPTPPPHPFNASRPSPAMPPTLSSSPSLQATVLGLLGNGDVCELAGGTATTTRSFCPDPVASRQRNCKLVTNTGNGAHGDAAGVPMRGWAEASERGRLERQG